MASPWLPVEPISPGEFARVRRRVIFDCQKWDPQVGDTCVIARFPLVLHRGAWEDVATMAKALARETLLAEAEIARRPALHHGLGLPRAVRRALAAGADQPPMAGIARLIRFDFHFTPEGWRISEANADVPGGLNEASGLPLIVAPFYPWAQPIGDPAQAYADGLTARAGRGASIALVHATAYSDDRQMMECIARRLAASGARPVFASPAQLRWHDGRAFIESANQETPIDAVVRFFPGDWLGALPSVCGWRNFFGGAITPLSNPATALVVQTKRWPLVWDDLATPLPTWRTLLPETRDPRDAPWRTNDGWVLKPALGRVGEGVGLRDHVEAGDWRAIRRRATFFPDAWVAQRRFETLPVIVGETPMYPCLGVYTLDDRVIGAYGRVARRPLIDARAEDAAVLAA